MAENLNHWGFVIASYAITVMGTAVLVASSLLAMRRAEARKERSQDL